MPNFSETIALAVKEALKDPIFLARQKFNTTGKIFWVMDEDDAGYVEFSKQHPTYEDGTPAIYSTFALGYAAMTSNQQDVLILTGHGSHSGAMVTTAKNRCTFIGVDGGEGGRKNSQAAKISTPATSVAASIAVINNTGTRNTFKNLKIIQSGTNVAQTSAFIDTGEGTYCESCQFEVNSILTTVTQAVLFKGDTCHYKNCQIGNSTVYHTALNQAPLVIQTPARYSYFEDCTIIQYSSQTTASCIDAPDADSVIGWIHFSNCQLISANKGDGATAGGTMAEAVTSVITSGYLLFDNKCNSFNATIFCEADASILLCSADEGTATLGGIAQPGA